MKHCIAPSLFTQSDLQFDPLAIFGLATAPCAARTSTIAASGAITVPEWLMLRLPAFENPSLECTPVHASGPGERQAFGITPVWHFRVPPRPFRVIFDPRGRSDN